METVLKIAFFIVINFMLVFQAQAINFRNFTIEEAVSFAEKEQKLIFVYFYSNSCTHCVFMEKNVFPDMELTNLLDETFIAIKSNAGNINGRMESYLYRISANPTILILNSNKIEIKRFVGKKELDFLRSEIKEINDDKVSYRNLQPVQNEILQKEKDDVRFESGNRSIIRQKELEYKN
jgi:hypothetical protein